jgi:hypothetical protein
MVGRVGVVIEIVGRSAVIPGPAVSANAAPTPAKARTTPATIRRTRFRDRTSVQQI